MTERVAVYWKSTEKLPPYSYTCGWCNRFVSSIAGYVRLLQNSLTGANAYIYLCPNCDNPTFRHNGAQYPEVSFGDSVEHVPDEVSALYEEARRATSASCYTSAVLACRKLLMNIAVSHGAEEGKSFAHYVDYLGTAGYVPPNGKQWVDHIRKKGNEATHEIAVMKPEDARDLINFIEMLLKFIYEFPARVPTPPAP